MLWRFWLPSSCWACWMHWKTYFESKWSPYCLNSRKSINYETTPLLFKHWRNVEILRRYFNKGQYFQAKSDIFNICDCLCEYEKILTLITQINLFTSLHVPICNSNRKNYWTIFKVRSKFCMVFGFILQLCELCDIKFLIH